MSIVSAMTHIRTCQDWINKVRCKEPATHRLIVDGAPALGGYVCQQHGEAIVGEYAKIPHIVGVWTMEPIDQ